MKEYEKVNLSYDPTINKKFSCKLRLLSDSDESSSFDVLSGIDGIVIPEQILNYNREGVYFQSKDTNKLQFENGTETNVDQNTFVNSNFITSIGESPIKINYEFIVGYKVDISNIRNTQVPATTICALCHKNIDGEYNYEDFGVYEQFVTQADGSTTSVYLSDAMFYNEGTADVEVFGICRQMKTSGENMLDECNPIATISTESQPIQTAGKLNSGDPLKQLVSNIGKLTFCQPHAHGLSEVNGVNIHEGNGTRNYGIPPDISGTWIDDDFLADTEYDQCGGINPRTFLFENPKYNLSLNTKNAINYNSEFLSTLDWNIITSEVRGDALEEGNRNWHSCKMREFTGFTGEDVAKFNRALVETMKNIYAYNPDYDQIDVNVGNIALQNYNPKFTSNLLSSDAKFTFGNTQTLNNFIYFGPILVSNYLKYLNLHSKTNDGEMIKVEEEVDGIKKPIPQLEFIPNFDYCGSSTNPYLISSLTYNTPVPASLESELEFSSSNIIVVKHSDGTNLFFEGRPNKKALYGYNKEYNKLIQLDVSNYKIDTNGVLTVSSDGAKETKSGSVTVNAAASENLFKGTHEFAYTFTNDKGESEELKLSLYLSKSNASTLTYDSEGFFMGMEETGAYNDYFYIRPFLNVYKKDTNSPYNYSAKVVNMKLKGNTKVLNDKITLRTYGSYKNLPNLKDQTATTLSSLISQTSQLVQPKYPSGSYSPVQSSTYWAYNGENYDIRANNTLISYSSATVEPDDNGQFKISFVKSSDLVDDWEFTTRLIKILIQEINFEVVQTSKLEATTESFLGSTKTTKYFNRDNDKYTVLTKFKDARFRGTSLTINDLVYEPSKDGHRLFVKNNCCIYNSSYRGKLYYRFLNGGNDKSHGSWDYSDTKNLNTLFLFTGPCFTSDNI